MKRVTKAALIKALNRAVWEHGHRNDCSAARGMESDCHCGWTEIRKLAGPRPKRDEPQFEYVPGYYKRVSK